MDSTIASVAAPAIRTDLGGSYSDLQWMAAAYSLAMAVMLLTGGWLGDAFGRKRMLLLGVGGFVTASMLCALAPSMDVLLAGRAVQGAMAAIMLPQVFGLLRDLFAPQEMGKAWAIFGPVMGLSAMLGPVLSGLVIGADLLGSSWRMIFFINLPIGLFVLVAGARHMPARAPGLHAPRLDLGGAALAGVAMFLVVFPLVQGRELGWPLWTQLMLVAAVPALISFAAHQLRRRRAGRAPLVEPSIFENTSYVFGVAFSTVFLGALGGVSLVLGVFLQAGLGYTPLHAALTTAPWALGGFIGSGIGGATMHGLGRRVLHVGLVIEIAGLVALYMSLRHAGAGVGSWDVIPALAFAGVGMGMVFVPLFDIILGGVRDHEVGSAAGVLQAVQQLGMALGIATVGTLFFGLLGWSPDHVADFVHAAQLTLLVGAGLLMVAFVIGFGLPRHARQPEGMAPASGDLRSDCGAVAVPA